ncbi:MAG: serine/threonine protein kinase [Polyangiales bacterium]|jgi:serine/threonine protein kinase
MGEVFLGVLQGAEGVSTPVVIKRIRPEFAQEASFRSMFRDEARALSFVRHPNVVQVIEFGAEQDELFLVMEYVEGESVTTLLRTVRKAAQAVPLAVAVHIVAQAASGLHAAHEQKNDAGEPLHLVHRDVSPQNILVTYAGVAKLIDFGIAKTEQQDALTLTGELKGKYGYMAPEQFMERPLDRRVDIFALGVVLFELVTARRLFKRSSAHAAMRAICDEPLPEPSLPDGGVAPPWLVKVMKRALARDPDERYASAQEFRRDLRLGLRELDPESRIEEKLPNLMLEYFSARRATKRQLMNAAKDGSMSDLESAAEYVVPTPSGTSLSSPSPSEVETRAALEVPTVFYPDSGSSRGRLRPVLLLLFACVVVGGAAWYGWTASVTPELAARPQEALADVLPALEAGRIAAIHPPEAAAHVIPIRVEVEPPAASEAAVIHVETRPSRVSVYLGGELQGRTPLDIEVDEPGAVTLTFRRRGYAVLEEEVDAVGQVQVNVVLRRRRRPSMRMRMGMATMEPSGDFAAFD